TDYQATLNNGSIAVAPTDPNTIYVGTGDATVAGGMAFSGHGILKSVDGGNTWTLLQGPGAVFDQHTIGKIIVSPFDAKVAFAVLSGTGINGQPAAGFGFGIFSDVYRT